MTDDSFERAADHREHVDLYSGSPDWENEREELLRELEAAETPVAFWPTQAGRDALGAPEVQPEQPTRSGRAHVTTVSGPSKGIERLGPGGSSGERSEELFDYEQDCGYELRDPKHPTYHERMSGYADA